MNYKEEKCPVCHKCNSQLLYSLEEGKLVSCQNCETVFFSPRPTPEELESFYNSISYRECYKNSAMTGESFARSRYQQLHGLVNRYAPSLLSKQNKHFLDIGCGEGDLLSVAAKDGWEITGTELSQKAVDRANSLLNNKVLTGDIHSLDLPHNFYDLITIYHVIEHLLDPVKTITQIKQLLKPGGLAFIETPNIGSLGAKIRGEKWSHITPPEHITYFQPSSLRYTLKKSGFTKFEVFTNSPHVIESVSNWSFPLSGIATTIYRLAPLFGLGATLQAIAFKI